jgi:beta-N-acetylhexosaminidase
LPGVNPHSSSPAAAIFGCAGTTLTDSEKRFFAATDPLGFILFGRNIETPGQVRHLVGALRQTVGRAAPILIDQEGGRVQRLKPPFWPVRPAMGRFAAMAAADLPLARRAARLNARLIAAELADLGIDVDCAPVLDLPVAGADAIIGDRALGTEPILAADLGRAVIDGLLDGGVLPVVKHIPGHGRATLDSHLALPRVDADRATLEGSDFLPFRSVRDACWAMTAHVIYSAYDARRPATLSSLVISEVVRGFIGCDAVLLTDDLSMRALAGGFDERAALSLRAGCDLVLHCNGAMAEMQAVAAGLRPLDDQSCQRLARAEARKRQVPPTETQTQLDYWLEQNA